MSENEVKIEAELKGTTLKAYWYIFKVNRAVGVRELQKALSLSSPSVALHHLEKLKRLGLLTKDELGKYYLKDEVKVGVFRFFFKFGKLLLPRFLFYAVFFSSALTLYLIQAFIENESPSFFALTLGFIASITSWYEAIKIWKEKLI
ncbi:MAG: helix-turn-helix domain-containing protein [Candidatus Bathyarchaeia archaeon]